MADREDGRRRTADSLSSAASSSSVPTIWRHYKSSPHTIAKKPVELEKTLRDRIYPWVYAEAQPKGRLIVMFEKDVIAWAGKLEKIALSGELANTMSLKATAPSGSAS
jgi:hypothetical protein